MSCIDLPSQSLPQLRAYKRGERAALGLDWSCELAEGETINTAATTLERQPTGSASIIEGTTIDDERTVTTLNIASDQTFGRYHLRHVMTTSAGVKFVQTYQIDILE